MKMLDRYKYIINKSSYKRLFLIFFGMIGMGFLEILSVSSIFPFMAIVTSPEIIQENEYLSYVYDFFSFSSNKEFLIWSGLAVICLLAITNAYNAFVNWKIFDFAYSLTHELSSRLLRAYITQSYEFFLDRNSSDLSKNILAEVSRSVSGVILPGLHTLAKIIVTFFLLLMLFLVNYIVALCIFTVLGGIYLLIYRIFRSNLKKRGIASTHATTQRYKITNESMHGIKDLKLKGSEFSYIERFIKYDKEFNRNGAIGSIIALLPRFILETITFGGIVLVVVLLIISGQSGQSIIPVLSLYALAGYRLMPALQQIYVGFVQLKYNTPALDILISDFKELSDEEIIHLKNPKKDLQFEKSFELSEINYKYPNSEDYILRNLNLKIFHNTTVGIVGPSGSGKTTLVDILLGLLDFESGKYSVDDITIDKTNILDWQKKFGYVPQDIFLSDDSITHNIAFSIPNDEIDQNQVRKVAKLANIDDFILSLPQGYETFAGDRGVRLSGGQRQRIGIARALYSDPDILVLDEATSALDGTTESGIMDAINNLSQDKTIIIIAHRLETVMKCDIIYFVNHGNTVDSGTYNELVDLNQDFREMAKKL
jgi:ATP-binding cassette, subfamily B, bacterial PglK